MEGALIGVSEGALEGILGSIKLGTDEGSDEFNALGINEWDSKGIKDLPLLGLKDDIIDGDILWASVGFPNSISDGIKIKTFDGVTIWISDGATLGFIDNKMLGVTDSCKIGI